MHRARELGHRVLDWHRELHAPHRRVDFMFKKGNSVHMSGIIPVGIFYSRASFTKKVAQFFGKRTVPKWSDAKSMQLVLSRGG